MKVDRLETHDRLNHFKKDQIDNINKGILETKQNPIYIAIQDRCPYVYIHAHARTCEDGITKKILWHPRISRPTSSENAMLFRCKSHSDEVEICWIIPQKELWEQFRPGKMTEENEIWRSINNYLYGRENLDSPNQQDIPDHIADVILRDVKNSLRQDKLMMESVQSMLNRESFERRK